MEAYGRSDTLRIEGTFITTRAASAVLQEIQIGWYQPQILFQQAPNESFGDLLRRSGETRLNGQATS